jgi:hypothetical protein
MATREVIRFHMRAQAVHRVRFPSNIEPSHLFEHSPPRVAHATSAAI